MKNFKCLALNTFWKFLNLPKANQFNRSLLNCDKVQNKVLFRLLKNNLSCSYGRKFNFDKISSIEQFQKEIPLTKYENYIPYINRISKGETGVLTDEKVLLFEPSSGSTSARKLIPYTASLRKEFQRGIIPWINSVYKQFPETTHGRAYWSVSPVNSREEYYGIMPVGFDRDSAYLGFISQFLFSYVAVEPDNIKKLQNIKKFRNETMACLLYTEDLSFISVWSPSFLKLLLDWYLQNSEEIYTVIEKRFNHHSANSRINKLKFLGKSTDVFEKIWPDLKMISCWTDAASKKESQNLKKYFPNIHIQGKGLVATEAFISLPYSRGCDPVLAIESHFFEFISEKGDCLLAHQLKKNCCYSVVVTTGGGFYRYNLEDRILVTGFIGNTPTIKFLGKTNNVSDQFGEKINELHVSKVINSVLDGINYKFCMLAPDYHGTKCGYTLYIEHKETLPADTASNLEKGLCENPHYKYCVELGQLRTLRIFYIEEKGYNIYESRLSEQGKKIGDIKISFLTSLDGWSDYFKGEYR